MTTVSPITDAVAFPSLGAADLALLEPMATVCSFQDGETVFRAGDAEVDLFVVESGAVEILNPADENRHVVTHGPGQFAGDIDLLTRRPVIVTAIARGPTKLMRVPGARLREILTRIPRLSEKMLIAIQERRRLLTEAGVLGLKVLDRLGPGGQASGSSKIENFIGFPSGLSGAELATRSVLQMLKFGAKMVAPVCVERIEPSAAPGDLHALHLDCGTALRARTVLI